MWIEGATFGAIMIDGKTYGHDVVIRLSGKVVKRKKKFSKKLYGTSHLLSKVEAKFLFEKGCDQVVIGSGQLGNVHLSPKAEAYFEQKGCEVLLRPTTEAIRMFNQSHAKRIGLFHVTPPVEAGPRIKALRKHYRKFLAENTSEARSLRLMRDWLSPDQREQFDDSGYFEVFGCDSGKRYRVYFGIVPPNVYEIDHAGRLKVGLCFMPLGRLAAGDVILAQKIALETDEHSALKAANRFSPNRECSAVDLSEPSCR
jgi:hypothetical protein